MNAGNESYLVLCKYALFVGIFGGILAVLIDIDHIPKKLGLTDIGRPAHIFLAVLAGVVACYCIACLGRLFYRLVLKNKKENTND